MRERVMDLVFLIGVAQQGLDGLVELVGAIVLLVTTPEPTALTDAYGLVKALHAHGAAGEDEVPTPELLVNLAAGIEEAEASATRLRATRPQHPPAQRGWPSPAGPRSPPRRTRAA